MVSKDLLWLTKMEKCEEENIEECYMKVFVLLRPRGKLRPNLSLVNCVRSQESQRPPRTVVGSGLRRYFDFVKDNNRLCVAVTLSLIHFEILIV